MKVARAAVQDLSRYIFQFANADSISLGQALQVNSHSSVSVCVRLFTILQKCLGRKLRFTLESNAIRLPLRAFYRGFQAEYRASRQASSLRRELTVLKT